jgi:hypothetical protein
VNDLALAPRGSDLVDGVGVLPEDAEEQVVVPAGVDGRDGFALLVDALGEVGRAGQFDAVAEDVASRFMSSSLTVVAAAGWDIWAN